MILTFNHFSISVFKSSFIIALRHPCCSTKGLCPSSKKILCIQTFGSMPRISTMFHPIYNLCFHRILINFSSYKGVNEVEIITRRVLEFPRKQGLNLITVFSYAWLCIQESYHILNHLKLKLPLECLMMMVFLYFINIPLNDINW